MDASIVDLRYHMNDVLKAIKRNERVNVFERNKLIGYFVPVTAEKKMRLRDHPFIGSAEDDTRPVDEIIRELRKPRDLGIPPLPSRPRKKPKKKS